MKEIPNKLHCAYCIRNRTHGGECTAQRSAYDEKGCLIFKPDERGCIRSGDYRIRIPLYNEVPLLDTWCKGWELNGVSSEIKVNRIHGLTWDTKTGELIMSCNCYYFVNEYHDDYIEPKEKTKLTIVK